MNLGVIDSFIEVTLSRPDDFLLIKETLTRIGIASNKTKQLFQSCHILHKQGKYYIVHFKELFALDGKPSSMDETDIARRNAIAKLLHEWNLCDIVGAVKESDDVWSFPEKMKEVLPMKQLKIISHAEKSEWSLVSKYSIGKKKA